MSRKLQGAEAETSVWLSVFPVTMTQGDLTSGRAGETAAKFGLEFNYPYLERYVDLAKQGRTLTIEILVDFPWQVLTHRSLENHPVRSSGFKTDSGDWTRPRIVDKPIQPEADFRRASRDAFFNLRGPVLEVLKDTPLVNASMVMEGFGEKRVLKDKPTGPTVLISSEYGIHRLPYDDIAREGFNRDLNALVALGGEPVLNALKWVDQQEDGGNLEFIPYPNRPVQLRRGLMGCSLSEIYITLDRVSQLKGNLLYVAAYNPRNRAHTSRFGPNTPYAEVIEPALEKLLSDRLSRPISVRSDFY